MIAFVFRNEKNFLLSLELFSTSFSEPFHVDIFGGYQH